MWHVLFSDFDIATYADDSTTYNVDKNVEFSFNNLEHLSSSILFKRFNKDYRKINTGKNHLLACGNIRWQLKQSYWIWKRTNGVRYNDRF